MAIHYTDPQKDVPPGVNFLDAEQARVWVEACEVGKPWREPMRRRFTGIVSALPSGAKVLELGFGPGYLAESVLESCPQVESYTLLDFSEHMLELSKERLSGFKAARFIKADFKTQNWYRELDPPYTSVLAMQAIHEIRHKRHVPAFYGVIRGLLGADGLLAVCDGTPRDAGVLWQASLHMTAEEQLEAFAAAGFSEIGLDQEIGSMILVTGRAPGWRVGAIS